MQIEQGWVDCKFLEFVRWTASLFFLFMKFEYLLFPFSGVKNIIEAKVCPTKNKHS